MKKILENGRKIKKAIIEKKLVCAKKNAGIQEKTLKKNFVSLALKLLFEMAKKNVERQKSKLQKKACYRVAKDFNFVHCRLSGRKWHSPLTFAVFFYLLTFFLTRKWGVKIVLVSFSKKKMASEKKIGIKVGWFYLMDVNGTDWHGYNG